MAVDGATREFQFVVPKLTDCKQPNKIDTMLEKAIMLLSKLRAYLHGMFLPIPAVTRHLLITSSARGALLSQIAE
jgi:hypothetical protein